MSKRYFEEAKERWGDSAAWREFEKRSDSAEEAADGLMKLFARLGESCFFDGATIAYRFVRAILTFRYTGPLEAFLPDFFPGSPETNFQWFRSNIPDAAAGAHDAVPLQGESGAACFTRQPIIGAFVVPQEEAAIQGQSHAFRSPAVR